MLKEDDSLTNPQKKHSIVHLKKTVHFPTAAFYWFSLRILLLHYVKQQYRFGEKPKHCCKRALLLLLISYVKIYY